MARFACKNNGKVVLAYELGAGTKMECKLIQEGKVVYNGNGVYELFSQESQSGSGELAKAGDYFKVDGKGYPYPNAREWFMANHRHLEGDSYEQLPKALLAWESTDEVIPEVQYLVDSGKLQLDPANPDKYFGAELWGAWLNAASDAVLVFYGVNRDEKTGEITNVDFNFVARSEFERTYHYE